MGARSVAGSPRFRRDLQSALGTIEASGSRSKMAARSRTWEQWVQFCHDEGLDPLLADFDDPLAAFLVFAVRYRSGEASKSGNTVRAGTVDDALRDVGQTMADMGGTDPRLGPAGKYVRRLERFLKGLGKEDPPPARVQPISLEVLEFLLQDCKGMAFEQAVCDLSILGFFFLCRPGEMMAPVQQSESAPFRLCDTEFILEGRSYSAATIPLHLLPAATAVRLEFTVQKNANRGEKITQARSGHASLCPVRAAENRVRYLRNAGAPHDTPLFVTYHGDRQLKVYARHLTAAFRHSVTTLGSRTGIDPARVSARSLRPGGATALLCANIDHDKIRLVGRWKSDAMIRYLHTQAVPAMASFAPAMLRHGHFTFTPNATVPKEATTILPTCLPDTAADPRDCLPHGGGPPPGN